MLGILFLHKLETLVFPGDPIFHLSRTKIESHLSVVEIVLIGAAHYSIILRLDNAKPTQLCSKSGYRTLLMVRICPFATVIVILV